MDPAPRSAYLGSALCCHRFDKAYTPRLLQATGGVGTHHALVFGGLEVASDRLLTLMAKGTTVLQVAQVAKNFRDAGIKVHGYIMYGFPTQTAQETIDALVSAESCSNTGC